MTDVKEMFKEVNWDDVEGLEDKEQEIPFLKGKYIAECTKFDFVEGTTQDGKEYAFFGMKGKVVETVEGIKGENRYFNKSFNYGEDNFGNSAEKNKAILLQNLKAMGATSVEDAIGKTFKCKLTNNGTKRDDQGWPKHKVTIVTEFKGATDNANVAEGGDSKIPF